MNEDNDENRRLAEFCYRTQKMLLNPIVDWTDDDVWEFLNGIVKVSHCCLYDEATRASAASVVRWLERPDKRQNSNAIQSFGRCTSGRLTA